MENEEKSLIEIAEDKTLTRVFQGVTTSYQEIIKLQKETAYLRGLINDTLAKVDDTALRIREAELIAERELNCIEWQRSLPLTSLTTAEINKALVEVEKMAVEVDRTGKNGRNGKSDDDFSLSYDDMHDAYQAPLAQHGLRIESFLIPGANPGSDDILKTCLTHTSEEFKAAYSRVNIDAVDQNMAYLQKRSSAIKYAKRHNLQALLGL